MEQLTAGLAELASGNLDARLEPRGHDEIGEAMWAFNDTAERLAAGAGAAGPRHAPGKLADAGAQDGARGEELADADPPDGGGDAGALRASAMSAFMEQACQIVVDEIETLERRVRAFSQFAAEPPVQLAPVDVNSLLEERIAFLKTAHPEVTYDSRLRSER